MIEQKFEKGKLTEIKIRIEELEKVIIVQSYFSVKKLDKKENTAGKIIENYREKIRDNSKEEAENYFGQNLNIIENFIEKLKFKNDEYDYVQIFYPSDQKRYKVLEDFSNKHFNQFYNYSDKFSKNQNRSVVGLNCEDAEKIFSFKKPDQINKKIKSLLIIDDTIDTGCTIKIFLNKLYKENLIDESTEIKAIIIYNNYKSSEPRLSWEEIKSRT